MFITNLIPDKHKYYECDKHVGDYLIENGIPLLSKIDEIMYFPKTKKLQKALKDMPFYLRVLVKAGVING